MCISDWSSDVCSSDLLGIAVGMQCYRAYRDILDSERWRKLAAAGALPQRLLWASTSTKDPAAPDTLYVEALAAPDTIDTIPDKTLAAFADHGRVDGVMAVDGGDAEARLARYEAAGVDLDALARQLQEEGGASRSEEHTSELQSLMRHS